MRGIEKLAIEERYYVYRHIRLDKNIPFYIGVGGINSAGNYARAYNTTQRNIFWQRIYQKTDIRVEIICETMTYQEALDKEIELISLYGRQNVGEGELCNICIGGKSGLKGVPLSEETKLKRFNAKIGKKMSASSIINMKIAQQKRWEAGSVAGDKEIYQYDLFGNFIKKWSCIKTASKSIGCKGSGINGFLYRNQPKAGNYLWYRDYQGETFTPPPILIHVDKIVQLDLNKNYIATFDCIQKASISITGTKRAVNIIPKICKGLRKEYMGYTFMYESIYLGINRTIQTQVN